MSKGVIYCIENKINGKKYIGQTKNIKRRWKEHKNCYRDMTITQAIKKYGIKNFELNILEKCNSEQLNEREKHWIKKYDTYEGEGYNCTPGGKVLRGENNPFYGRAHTEEAKNKMSKSSKGKKNGMYGTTMSEKERKKLGKILSKKHANFKGGNHPQSIIKYKHVFDIMKYSYESDLLQQEIAEKFNTSTNVISRVINLRHWTTKDLEKKV